ncbi:MAG: glycosyltransferase family 2 protein, partial [Tolypothrix sp. Co-bin9]|nr:glycosyltransferase family 2 protein [Tolypothrix sp. Co-bin9]
MSSKIDSKKSLVSVIIPTYNRPKYLKQAIESAIKQTYKNIEIIVSDDCSPEN